MNSQGTFENLVRQLQPEERRALMEKWTTKEDLTFNQPSEPEERTMPDYTVILKTYSWWKRFFLYLKALFSGDPVNETVKNQVFSDLGSELEGRFPNWMNTRTRIFFPHFYFEMKHLADAFKVFKAPLNTAFGKEKGDFFAFMVGTAMEDIQQRILLETDHKFVYNSNPERPNNEIKAIVEGNLRVILDTIPQDIRRNVYLEVKKFHYLQLAANFDYSLILNPFQVTGETPTPVPMDEIAEPLVSMWSRLAALDGLDLHCLLENLLLFHLKSQNLKDEEMERALEQLVSSAKESLDTIKEFRTRVPLSKFCALAVRNIEVRKEALPGIEDWFTQYRTFWRNKIAKDFQLFNRERTQKMLMSTICHFLDIDEELFNTSKTYPRILTNTVYPVQDRTLTFLKLFFQRSFMHRFHPLLKIVFVEGEFYKKSNRSEFTDCFNSLLRFSEELDVMVKRVSAQGDIGSKLIGMGAKDEDQQIQEVQNVFQMASDQIQEMVRKITPTFQSLFNLLHGITKTEPGGTYDTLVNIGQIGGKNNSIVRKELLSLSGRTDLFLKILLQLVELERG